MGPSEVSDAENAALQLILYNVHVLRSPFFPRTRTPISHLLSPLHSFVPPLSMIPFPTPSQSPLTTPATSDIVTDSCTLRITDRADKLIQA